MKRTVFLIAAVLAVHLLAACGGGDNSRGASFINDSPSANAGPDQSIATGVTCTLDGSGSWDPDGNRLTYRWSFVEMPDGSKAELSDSSAVKPAFVPDVGGRYRLSLVVNDGQYDSLPDRVYVFASSAPPVADAGPDQGVAKGSRVRLNGSNSTDVDGNLFTYSWSFVSTPPGSTATLSNSSTKYPTFTADLAGSYTIDLTVDDGISGSATDTVVIKASAPPTADAGNDRGVATNSLVTLDGTGSSDPDVGDTITYSWSFVSIPGGPAVLSDALASQPTFTPLWDGEYVISLVVNDGTVDSAMDLVTISASSSPVADAGPDKNYTIGAPVTLDGTKSFDPDGSIISYDWSFQSVPLLSSRTNGDIVSAPTATPSFSPDAVGDYTLSLVVSDGTSTSTPDTVTISTLALPGAPTAPVPDTGQTLCSEATGTVIACAGTGQDGDYTINPMSFTITGDGTRTDNVTGLMWQKCTNGQTGLDCTDTPAQAYNWYEAAGIYDATYNPGPTDACGSLTLSGYSDWRLPSEIELIQILDMGTFLPSIGTFYFPNTVPFNYWSSTCLFPPTCGTAFWVEFGYGTAGYGWGGNVTEDMFVRCVRGTSPVSVFADNGDGTVKDRTTGLEWQQLDDGATRTWQQALDYCNGLLLDGHADWRLPDIKELTSAIAAQVYLPSSGPYWSSTNAGTTVWVSYPQYGAVLVFDSDKEDYPFYTRCVR